MKLTTQVAQNPFYTEIIAKLGCWAQPEHTYFRTMPQIQYLRISQIMRLETKWNNSETSIVIPVWDIARLLIEENMRSGNVDKILEGAYRPYQRQ